MKNITEGGMSILLMLLLLLMLQQLLLLLIERMTGRIARGLMT